MQFSEKIVAWQAQHGRSELPWQQATGDVKPYHVWLSEIMLQQTQVVKVKDYFGRFIEAFPTLTALAKATKQQVLAMWSGLGYYNRARNLHKAAQICASKHQGTLPADLDLLMALPGIGRSTAAAIMSLAYDQPEPIMDGNVKRVFARHFLVAGEPNKSATMNRFWQLAERHKTKENPAAYTQGLMDLGALVCTKHQPQCQQCPISNTCLAKAENVIEQYPEKKQKVVQKQMDLYVVLIMKDQALALELRDDSSIWPNLWFLPIYRSETELQSEHKETQLQFSLTHKLTHRILHIHVYTSKDGYIRDNWQWIDLQELENIPHPKALIHLLNQYENHKLH